MARTRTRWRAVSGVAAGVGALLLTSGTGVAAMADVAPPDLPPVAVNEVETDEDWIEITNTGDEPVDVSGWIVKDDNDNRTLAFPDGSVLEPGGFLSVLTDAGPSGFGLGANDEARIFLPDGTTLVDAFAWTGHPATSYGRCTDRFGDFAVTASATPGAVNDCSPPAAAESLVINEVESNNDDTDWVELYNLGDEPIDLSGFVFRDDNDNRGYVLPEGSVVEPGGFFVIDQQQGVRPGFDFGLGNQDQVRLFAPDGATLIVEHSWSEHAAVTYGRCPDGTGEMQETTVSTKGGPNDCSTPLRLTEIDSKDGGFVEILNIGTGDVDTSGLVLRTAAGEEQPLTGTLAPGEYHVLEGLALQAEDEVALREADGEEVDSYAWTDHAETSYGRCPDWRGEFEVTLEATPGADNRCEGATVVSPWPGGEEIVVLDEEDDFEGDLSGLFYEPGESGALGTLWAVENGNSLLFKILPDGQGGWSPDVDADWAGGLTLRYPDGTGAPDAEGVTLTDAGVAGGVYVGTERNNAESSVSRPSVLRYDVSDAEDELVATDEWNLAEDFPGLGANLGIEGLTWIPDTWLTGQGFLDESTGAAYDPAAYPGHGGGLFFIGFEGTAAVYAYALLEDGSFHRVAEIQSSFDIVAEVQFDRDRDVLWVVCDDTCQGRIATFEVDADGVFTESAVYARPAGMPDLNNEGFTFLDTAHCVDGRVQTFYSDDNDTDGFSLRSGTLDCPPAGGPGPVDPPEEPGEEPGTEPGGDGGSSGPGAAPGTPPGGGLPSTGVAGVVLLALAALLAVGVGVGVRRAVTQP